MDSFLCKFFFLRNGENEDFLTQNVWFFFMLEFEVVGS
jgi:hypothetical protein